MDRPSLFISAGDPSGDNAASRLLETLKLQLPNHAYFGLGGERMASLGQHQLAESSRLAVLGFWEVARQYGFFRKLMHSCVAEIESRRPDAVVLVDYPGFNMRLAKRVKKLGIPIIYYISPQVWAWGKKRLREIKELVDLMLIILPFEQEFFEKANVPAQFVGHYLLEDIPEEYIASSAPSNGGLALLPGSRQQEIERMLPTMVEAATVLHDQLGVRSTIAGISRLGDYGRYLNDESARHIDIVYDEPRRVVFENSLAVVASGTATLEAGIIGRPMVVMYKTGWITFQIAKRLVKLDSIALINLVLGKKIVPELIQHHANAEEISKIISLLWENERAYNHVQDELHKVPSLLGGKGASERAAAAIVEVLKKSGESE